MRARLPAPAGQAELEAFVSELASTDLDRNRPLWQFHFIERFQGGSAAVLRIHHCYADGMAMIRVFLSLTDAGPGAAARPAAARETADEGPPPETAAARFEVPGAGLLRQAFAEGSAFVERAAALLQDPAQAGELARHGLGIAGELARVATLADDPPTRFKGPLGSRKIAAWTEPLPLHEVKALARALRCTVNDLLLVHRRRRARRATCASTARTRTASRSARPCRSTCAIPRRAVTLGNHFGLVFLELPIGIRDPLERLFAVHAAMTQLKGSYQPVLTLGLMAALGRMPASVESAAIDLLSTKASAVATNVPGPQHAAVPRGRAHRQAHLLGAAVRGTSGSASASCPMPGRCSSD